ncbi:transposase [Alcanivorax sp. JB21]|uniref:transposase n=1 Tax=Alcanivorax limicola TaxID=2874102 RepID=UPI001CBF24AB|nr:transposase [Alcanivorax limicola]MBZ2188520.1 transposase [Alcanivorax limicola]
MSERDRLLVSGVPHHIVRKTANKMQLLRRRADYIRCIGHLYTLRENNPVNIHAWALLPDRIHLLVTPTAEADALSQFVKALSCRVTRGVRLCEGESPWERRFRSSPVQPGQWFLTTMHYIERLPALAGLARAPHQYPYSSYRMRVGKSDTDWLDDHPDYAALGQERKERIANYRQYLASGLNVDEIRHIESALASGGLTGSKSFEALIDEKLRERKTGT